MPATLLPAIVLILFLAFILAYLAFYWRFHVRQTRLDSFTALQQRLRAGKPAVIQFSAPL
jgi:hypothetical protein